MHHPRYINILMKDVFKKKERYYDESKETKIIYIVPVLCTKPISCTKKDLRIRRTVRILKEKVCETLSLRNILWTYIGLSELQQYLISLASFGRAGSWKLNLKRKHEYFLISRYIMANLDNAYIYRGLIVCHAGGTGFVLSALEHSLN